MQRVIKAAVAALWFMLLTLPVLGLKLNTIERTVTWRLDRIALLGVAIFGLAMLWDWCFSRKARGQAIIKLPAGFGLGPAMAALSQKPKLMAGSLAVLAAAMIIMPLVSSFYQTNIMISALLYVMLALGLNIVVGLAGQLVLGYVAFYAVGAYAYEMCIRDRNTGRPVLEARCTCMPCV